MIVKVCGMREPRNIRSVEALGVDMMGFILYPPSPRYVAAIPDYLPQAIQRVGVFVDEQVDVIIEKSKQMSLNYIQLHGNESVETVKQLASHGLKVIKALSIANVSDIDRAKQYQSHCDMLIFDTKCEAIGGSGRRFDWSWLECYRGDIPFLLSGGIGLENIAELLALRHPQLAGYDINSRFETSPAIKDIEQIKLFIKRIKRK